MGQAGTIPAPRGHPTAAQEPARYPTPVPAGTGRPAALPARAVVSSGPGGVRRLSVPGPGGQVIGGQWGAIDATGRGLGLFDAAYPVTPVLSAPALRRQQTFVRRLMVNAGPFLRYLAPILPTPNWSTNTRDGDPVHGAPSPISRARYVVQTYRMEAGTTRELFPLKTTPRVRVQRALPTTIKRYRHQAAGRGGAMSKQHYNRLANYARAQSYGQQTKVLWPPPSPSTSAAAGGNMPGMGAF